MMGTMDLNCGVPAACANGNVLKETWETGNFEGEKEASLLDANDGNDGPELRSSGRLREWQQAEGSTGNL
jgi:hypothetical protein